MSSLSDSFGERLRANYAIMAASFSPKDLLFLLAGSPEMPPVSGGMTAIAVDNRIENRQNILIDVVNNIVNRVLLEDRSELTYQDRVYIDTALTKLGIQNVTEFIRQVRAVRQENLSIFKLLSLYRDNFATLSSTIRETAVQVVGVRDVQHLEDARHRESKPELYIHNEIYSRLQIAELYSQFSNYLSGMSERFEIIDRRELAIAEQSRVADMLTLSEYKQRTLLTENLTLTHQHNRYELGDLLAPPDSEEEVLTQASASVLLNVIDNIMQTRIENYLAKQDFWIDAGAAISQSAENSLSRFVSYHSEQRASFTENRYDAGRMAALYTAEADVINSFLTQIRQGGAEVTVGGAHISRAGDLNLSFAEKNERHESHFDTQTETSEAGDTISTTDIQNLTRQILNMTPQSPAAPGKPAANLPAVEMTVRESQEMRQSDAETAADVNHINREGDISLSFQQKAERHESHVDAHVEMSETGDTVSSVDIQNLTRQILNVTSQSPAEAVGIGADLPAAEMIMREHSEVWQADEPGGVPPSRTVLQALTNITRAQNMLTQLRQSSQSSQENYYQTVRSVAEAIEFSSAAAQYLTSTTRIDVRQVLGDTLSAEVTYADAQNVLTQLRQTFHDNEENYYQTIRSVIEALGPQSDAARGMENTTKIDARQTYGDTLNAEITYAETARESDESLPPDPETQSGRRDIEEVTVRRALDEINRKNRERYERMLQHKITHSESFAPPAPDRKRILRDALRAIEAPEQVLVEAMQAEPPAERKTPPEVAAALAEADEVTRRIYQAVTEYRRSPDAPLGEGAIRAAEPSVLNVEAERILRERVELEHISERQTAERQTVGVETETVLERMIERTAARSGAMSRESGWRVPVSIIHKQTESQISEEMLSLLERQRTEQAKEVEHYETVTETTQQQTLVNRQVQEITSKTTEDVTELINRTLARQIGTISDRVYSQLERRLQTERARRGRY